MRELFLLMALLGALQVHAKEKSKKKVDLAPPGQAAASTEDPGSATRLLYEDPRSANSLMSDAEKKQPKAAVQATCTDEMGMIHTHGAPGFDSCLRTQQNQRARPYHQPSDSKRPTTGVGITFGK